MLRHCFLAGFFVFGVASCASSGIRYSGVYADPVPLEHPVRVAAFATQDSTLLGHVQASCEQAQRDLEQGLLLGDLVCTEALLQAALVDTARYVGGTQLAQISCEPTSSGHRCGGLVFRDDEPPKAASSRAPLADPWSIEVRLNPAQHQITTAQAQQPNPARGAEQVRIVPGVPVSNHVLGEVSAHCRGECSVELLRRAVRVGAGYLGAQYAGEPECRTHHHGARHKGSVCRTWASAYEVDTKPVAVVR